VWTRPAELRPNSATDLSFNNFSQSHSAELLISHETTPLSFRAAKIECLDSMVLAEILSATSGVMSEASILWRCIGEVLDSLGFSVGAAIRPGRRCSGEAALQGE
jgi:hypothetical protein